MDFSSHLKALAANRAKTFCLGALEFYNLICSIDIRADKNNKRCK